MSPEYRLIIDNWHYIEESYQHGKMVLFFTDKPSIVVDNMNEQKFLTCVVDTMRLCYTHIESFVSDYSHLLSNVQKIITEDGNGQRKRKRKSSYHSVEKKTRNAYI